MVWVICTSVFIGGGVCVCVCVCVCVHACVLFMCCLTKDYVCNFSFPFIPNSVCAHGLSQSNSILLGWLNTYFEHFSFPSAYKPYSVCAHGISQSY